MNLSQKQYDYVSKKSFEIIDKYNSNHDLSEFKYIKLHDFNQYIPEFKDKIINMLKYSLIKEKRKNNIRDFYLCRDKYSNNYFIIITGKLFNKKDINFIIIERDTV